ncbi:uncharacterized protein [Miscanthus floridulus]|uniref:uncharacterized protein n=1 Tax=Miscanthus floridulus TaxID=154761 RepID=UPI00345832CA
MTASDGGRPRPNQDGIWPGSGNPEALNALSAGSQERSVQEVSACSGGRIVSWIIYCWLIWCERKTLFPAGNLRSFTSKRTAHFESSGVLDTLTKVLVALYEENDKPSSAVEFVQQKLGGPSISDYEKLKAEKLDLQLKYDKLLETHKETCRQLEELKNMKYGAPWN